MDALQMFADEATTMKINECRRVRNNWIHRSKSFLYELEKCRFVLFSLRYELHFSGFIPCGARDNPLWSKS